MSLDLIITGYNLEEASSLAHLAAQCQLDFRSIQIKTEQEALTYHPKASCIIMLDIHLLHLKHSNFIKNVESSVQTPVYWIVTGPRDFEQIYEAIRNGANDYLAKPFKESEIKESLNRALAFPLFQSSHRFYIDDKEILAAFKKQSLSLLEFNQIYGTHFCDGLFQMLLTRIELPSLSDPSSETPAQVSRLNQDILDWFQDICADRIIDKKSDSSIVLLNYPSSARLEIQERINCRLLPFLSGKGGLRFTVHASGITDDIYHVWELKEQIRDLEWARMATPKKQLLCWDPSFPSAGPELKDFLAQALIQIRTSFETLDIPDFLRVIDAVFSFPVTDLMTHDTRIFIKSVLALLFELYEDSIHDFADPTRLHLNILFSLRRCTSFSSYRNQLVKQCTTLMNTLSDSMERKYSPAVMEAIHLIKHNLDQKITLEWTADQVHMNKSYFSFLFHKELGQSFSKYVNEQKNILACSLLKSTALNISEISYRTGFSTVQAFGKQFKIMNNMTPTQYRQLYLPGREPHSL